DDDVIFRTMTKQNLEVTGYEVCEAEDGLTGMQLFRQERPDCVLLDIKMPGLSGLDVLEKIKRESPHTQVIMVSGFGDKDEAIRALNLGAFWFLEKPIPNPDTVLGTITRNALKKGELERKVRLLEEEMARREGIEKALKLSEKNYRTLVDICPDVIYQIDHNGYFKDINPAFTAITGYSREEIIGKHFSELFHPEDVYQFSRECALPELLGQTSDDVHPLHLIDERRCSSRTAKNLGLRIRRRDPANGDDYLFGEISACGYWNEDEFLGTVGVIRDVTERKKAEEELIFNQEMTDLFSRGIAEVNEELETAKAEAEVASRAKGEFLANMSHEIRTPLQVILGTADLLQETPLTPDQRQYVQILQSAGDNLLALINDILDFSKIEAGHIQLEETAFNPFETIRRTCEVMAYKAQEKGLKLLHNVHPDIPSGLIGDPVRLNQILLNLISNAIKFTSQGEIAVEAVVTTEELEDQSSEEHPWDTAPDDSDRINIKISVRDTGIGIPPDKLDLIFESFTQADTSTTRQYGGTGLGLSISHRLVELMGGRIWVSSRPDQGSTFFFTAEFKVSPYGDNAVAPTGPVQTGRMKVCPGQPAGIDLPASFYADCPGRILLVDDSVHNQFLMQAFLKQLPCRVDVAQHGKMAVEMVTNNQYDLVLLDVQMPIMDGYTAARTIRAWEQETGRDALPIIALTAHAFAEDVKKSLEAGYSDHLSKPIRKDKLIEVVCQYLRGRIPVSRPPEPQPAPVTEPVSDPAGRIELTLDADIQELTEEYLSYLAENVETMYSSLDAGDFDTIYELGHTMKGTGGSFGLNAVTEIGALIQEAAEIQETESVKKHVKALSEFLADVVIRYH
ncbi:MAG: response regulator, partial [Deltaproteobacteria bacterium]|nr:response regulator [Deltaproteobacteria bacterium]